MASMPDKGISSFRYNYLNLPNNMLINKNGNENIIINTKYRADGIKLRKENTTDVTGFNGSITTINTTDYLDGFQYLHSVSLTPPGGGGFEMLAASALSRRAMEPQAFSLTGPVDTDPTIDPPFGGGGIIVDVKTPDLQFFPTAEGFYDYQKNQYIYQYKDHLGNNRVSYGRNSAGVLEITDANDYYPFGMNHLKTGNAYFGQGSYKSYKYNGKELQESGMYDYGARMYMADIGRWGVVDPKSELLESASSYVYALNSPILYIDKDGELPILINGRVFDSDLDRANVSYWSQGVVNTIKGSGIPNPGGEVHFVDGDRYLSQSFSGDWNIKKGSNFSGNNPGYRYEAGKRAMNPSEFNKILSKLARDPKSGKITEKIQIYTHSRGAAFGIGYTERLLELINEHSNEFADPNNVVDFVLNMAPHQSDFLKAPYGVDSYSIDHTRDKLSDNDMKGVKGAFSSDEKDKGFFGAHSVTSFQNDLKGFATSFSKGGSSKQVINNFIQEMKKKYNVTVTVNQ